MTHEDPSTSAQAQSSEAAHADPPVDASSGRWRQRMIPVLVAAILAGLAATFWTDLRTWFGFSDPSSETNPTTEPRDPSPIEGSPAHALVHDVPPPPSAPLPDAVREATLQAWVPYEALRAALASDTVEAAATMELVQALQRARDVADGPLRDTLTYAFDAATRASLTDAVEDVRVQFGRVTAALLALGAADPRITEGLWVFECPMTEGFNRWVQPSSQLENPYMGRRMLTCGTRVTWDTDTIAYYTCPMHPSIRAPQPGQCPICGMDLTPVMEHEVETGTLIVDEDRRRRIGLQLEVLATQPLVLPIRALGQIAVDETRLHDVELRSSGWIRRLHVDTTGQVVQRGQTLFTMYSPELLAAQREYLSALGHAERRDAADTTGSSVLRAGPRTLAQTAKERLRLLGMSEAQLETLAQRRKAWEDVPIVAPAGGFVLEKNVVQGSRVEPGMTTHRIAGLDRVWLQVSLYASDFRFVRVGQPVRIEVAAWPGETLEGTVDFVYPTLDPKTRTGTARITLPNPDRRLHPEMYATVILEVDLGARLVVPDSAVLFTGPRRVVFVDQGEGRLAPRDVELGVHTAQGYEVLSGVREGEVVVTSGNFLIAAESRLKSARGGWMEDASHAHH